MFKSIRWKFITIYFLLVFIAMIIVGVFIIQQLQEYHLSEVRKNLTDLAEGGLLRSFEKFDDIDINREEIQTDVDTWARVYKEDIFVINMDFKIIASSNSNLINKSAVDLLDYQLLTDAYNGEVAESNTIQRDEISSKNIVFPIRSKTNRQVVGVLYLKSNLTSIYDSIEKSEKILTQATLLALVITVFLGYFIARSITEPIKDVTVKASKMAKGDFNQTVEVKSDDEIGQLAEMFNYLREKLKITLTEVYNEKSKLQTILDYMADGLIAINNEGLIIHINPTAIRMLGLKDGNTQDLYYNDIMQDLNPQLTMESMESYNDGLVGNEIIELNKIILHANFAPYKDEKGSKAGIVMVLQDITESQRLDHMRKEFVANVSHELKTPLTSIKSYTETLLEGALDDRELSENFLQVVNSEADRMSRLIKDLLQLSSLDYNQTKWNKTENDLVKITENCVLKMSMTAKNKNQSISFSTNSEKIFIYSDMDRIEQVILNILSNAIKYTPNNGNIKVLIEEKNQEALLRIIDDGIGIPKDDIPRLFERFYRVDKARSRELGGTGLGLSIAQQIIEAHDGRIDIISDDGKGTEVAMALPLNEKSV